jgi:hypothetical protein
MDREKAIDKIYSLRKLAEHPNTPIHEAEAARAAIKRLRTKHDIPERQATKATTGPRNPNWRPDPAAQQASRDFEEAMRGFAEATRRTNERMRQAEAERTRQEREEAQRRYQARHANHDQYGRPKPSHQDLFDEALRQDGRTQAQKQADLNNAWGRQAEQRRQERQAGFKRCERPETFFDQGGLPRKRNDRPMQCDKCSWTLGVGEGMVWEIGGRTFARCCEAKPGPRAKRR